MKPAANVKTPAQYIASLPADRAKTIATVRAFVNQHIPPGYEECMVWGSIGWTIPLSRYPDTHNKQPILYVGTSSQKNYCVLYLMGAFWSASQLKQLKAAFAAAGKKLDMGGCCVNFKSPDDLPLEAIGKLISAISSEKWIEMYEETRLKTKAGQAKAKQGAASARKVTAKRSATKRVATSAGAKLSPHNCSPVKLVWSAGIQAYSARMRSDHSTSETKMVGLPYFAFQVARSLSETPRAREQAPHEKTGMCFATIFSRNSLSAGQPMGVTASVVTLRIR